MSKPSRICPCLRYQDAPAAIEWLGRAFGFEPQLVVPGDEGVIHHAQLISGEAMVMLGSERDEGRAYDAAVATPRTLGRVTTSMYVLVEDVDAHHARAVAAGAEVIMPLEDKPYGRDYTCRDPEGHVWSFGSYDPWTSPS